jgi:hypothetical protein
MSLWITEITIKVKHDDMHDTEGLMEAIKEV